MSTQSDQPMASGSHSQIMRLLKWCVAAMEPAFLWGAPGIGKSDTGRALAREFNAAMLDTRASQLDATDTRGIPYTYEDEDGNTRTGWANPDLLPTHAFASQHPLVILFLDELNTAPLSTQAALYQLILDRRLGDYVLPDNVYVMAAGNREGDNAITNRMTTALASRFFHFEMVVDHDDWEAWAFENDIEPGVIAFLRWRPELLHHFEPKSKSKAQPDPRGWHKLSNVYAAAEANGDPITDPVLERMLVAGKVGDAAAADFCGFMKVCRDVGDPSDIINDPDNAPIHSDPSVTWAVCGALSRLATAKNFANIIRYATRLRDDVSAGAEFMVLVLRGATLRDPDLKNTKAYADYVTANADVYL